MNKDIDKIIKDFELFCIENDKAAKQLNNKLANKYAKKIINSFLQLREINSIKALECLLESDNDNVRLWAATHTLKINTKKSRLVLEELSSKEGLNAFSAEMTLRQWDSGNLKLEYPDYTVKW